MKELTVELDEQFVIVVNDDYTDGDIEDAVKEAIDEKNMTYEPFYVKVVEEKHIPGSPPNMDDEDYEYTSYARKPFWKRLFARRKRYD